MSLRASHARRLTRGLRDEAGQGAGGRQGAVGLCWGAHAPRKAVAALSGRIHKTLRAHGRGVRLQPSR
eukprot:1056818-Prymnesium_polylepis.1